MTALAALPFARIVRAPRVLLSVLAWVGVAVLIAVVVRSRAGSHGADQVLPEIFGGVVLPLLVFALVGGVVASTSLRASVRAVTALGAGGSRAALVSILVAALVAALVCGGLGAALVPLSGSPSPMRADIIATAWVSALGAVCYASLFSFGATFGRRGAGRVALLLADWIAGSTSGLDIATPRAHLRNLLGGPPLPHVSQTASAITLGVVTIVLLAISARRAR